MVGCASAPKVSQVALTRLGAEQWLQHYCSSLNFQKISAELSGEVVMKATTKEFKGQYPASIHFEANGVFSMEVTNIIGGTLLGLHGSPQGINIEVPSKPRYNRKNVNYYLGLELEILMQLLHGDLPCPLAGPLGRNVKVEGTTILAESPTWKWIFERASEQDGAVPVHIRLVSKALDGNQKPVAQIELKIEDWDREQNYAKKS